ncbi:MAG: XRE family transcriptional regulator [Clostridia bacterium]|jgi:repressor LexA|nr:XRE family transcriptional regulator [Clostridia bacterium]
MDKIIFEKVGKRLKQARELRHITLEDAGKKVDVHKSTVLRWENGETEKIKLPVIEILANYYNVNPVWLMGYDVPMERHEIDSNIFPDTDTPKKIPVVGKISAGLPILATENIEGYEFAPSSQIKEGYTYFYLRVQGDSMNLKFNEGDIVLVQKQDDLENNEIGVILVNGFDATVKKYRKENGLVILEPMSTNPENTVQIYNPKDISIKVIGKVISYQGKI